jgi:hypothetical protein
MHQIIESGFDQLDTHGAASSYDLGDVERLFQLLLADDVLGQRFQVTGAGFTHAYVITGKRSKDLLQGRFKMNMAISSVTAKKVVAVVDGVVRSSRSRPESRPESRSESRPDRRSDHADRIPRAIVQSYPSNEYVDLTDEEDCHTRVFDELLAIRHKVRRFICSFVFRRH